VTLLHYLGPSEVLGVLQRAKDSHTTRKRTYKRVVCALLNEYLDGDDFVDHLHSLMQATQEKWEDDHEFANRILDANRALVSVLREAQLKIILLKGVGREVRALGRNLNTQGRTVPKLRKFLANTGAATRAARGVKLQAKPKGSNSRSAGGEEREPDVPGPPPRRPSRWGLPRPPRPWPSRTTGRKRKALSRPPSSPRRWRPPNTARSGTLRYFRSTACRPRRYGNNNPRGVDARRCTPSTPAWAAAGALWRRVPRSRRLPAPCSHTSTGRLGSRAAGRPRHAVGAAPARPPRHRRRAGGGPAPFAAT